MPDKLVLSTDPSAELPLIEREPELGHDLDTYVCLLEMQRKYEARAEKFLKEHPRLQELLASLNFA